MITGYVSAKTVIAKIYRDLNLTEDVNEYHVIEWIAEILDKIGTYSQYIERKTCLELIDGKAQLPVTFYKLKDIAFNNKPLAWSTETMFTNYSCEGCTIPKCCLDHTFYISNNQLITSLTNTDVNESGDNYICIIYLAIPLDDEGYPLVPNDPYFMEACSKYVTYMLDYREWRKGNIPDKVLDFSQKEYLFYVRAAKGSANMPSLHQMENLKNIWVRMLPLQNEYKNFFGNLNNQEKRYLK